MINKVGMRPMEMETHTMIMEVTVVMTCEASAKSLESELLSPSAALLLAQGMIIN